MAGNLILSVAHVQQQESRRMETPNGAADVVEHNPQILGRGADESPTTGTPCGVVVCGGHVIGAMRYDNGTALQNIKIVRIIKKYQTVFKF